MRKTVCLILSLMLLMAQKMYSSSDAYTAIAEAFEKNNPELVEKYVKLYLCYLSPRQKEELLKHAQEKVGCYQQIVDSSYLVSKADPFLTGSLGILLLVGGLASLGASGFGALRLMADDDSASQRAVNGSLLIAGVLGSAALVGGGLFLMKKAFNRFSALINLPKAQKIKEIFAYEFIDKQ